LKNSDVSLKFESEKNTPTFKQNIASSSYNNILNLWEDQSKLNLNSNVMNKCYSNMKKYDNMLIPNNKQRPNTAGDKLLSKSKNQNTNIFHENQFINNKSKNNKNIKHQDEEQKINDDGLKIISEEKTVEGKIIRLLEDESKEVIFSNGVKRITKPNGYSIV
jgi:hypothetical protein